MELAGLLKRIRKSDHSLRIFLLFRNWRLNIKVETGGSVLKLIKPRGFIKILSQFKFLLTLQIPSF